MRELISAYLEHLGESGRSGRTRGAVTHWLGRFARFCEERNLGLAELAPPVVAAYHTRLLWEPHTRGRLYAPASVDMGLRLVRGFLRWAVGQGALYRDPARHLVLSRPPSRPRPVWSPAEKEALLAAPDATPTGLRDRAMLALFLNTTLTRPQLGGLDLADFDPQTYGLTAHRGRSRNGPRELVLSDEVAQILLAYLTEGRPRLVVSNERAFFLSYQGRRYAFPQLCDLLRKYRIPL